MQMIDYQLDLKLSPEQVKLCDDTVEALLNRLVELQSKNDACGSVVGLIAGVMVYNICVAAPIEDRPDILVALLRHVVEITKFIALQMMATAQFAEQATENEEAVN